MKIALLNCSERSIPPLKSGGIEKIMYHLIRGLAARGHDITVFSTGDSKLPRGAELVSVIDKGLEYQKVTKAERDQKNVKYTLELGKLLVKRQYEFDIIHNHCLGAALPILKDLKQPVVSTIHESLEFEAIDRLAPYKHLPFVSVSFSQRKTFSDLNYVATVYAGMDMSKYPLPRKHDNYFATVCRISSQKNPHLAIEVAARLNEKLIIVGKFKDECNEKEYYKKVFLPTLKKHKKHVEWIGEADEKSVLKILNRAQACLFPVSFREPGGMAAMEAMAVGCPVVAFRKGGYSETVIDGKTGYLVEDIEEMVDVLKRIDTIDRKSLRAYAETRFSAGDMVEEYIRVYRKVISQSYPNRVLQQHQTMHLGKEMLK